MNKQSFENYLENNDRLVYRNTGTSMLPLLKQGRDFLSLKKLIIDLSKNMTLYFISVHLTAMCFIE